MTNSPGRQAAQDQSDTAFSRAVVLEGIVLAAHSTDGIAHVTDNPGPDATEAREQFHAWMKDTPVQCAHLPMSHGSQLAHWSMWNRRLHCTACFEANHEEVKGTPEDRRCDFCGVIQEPGAGCLCTGGYVLQIPPSSIFEIWPPIIVHYGICKACREKP
jgi:hypothetical protein